MAHALTQLEAAVLEARRKNAHELARHGLTLRTQGENGFAIDDHAGTNWAGWSYRYHPDVAATIQAFLIGYAVGKSVARPPDPVTVREPLCVVEHGYLFAPELTALIQAGEAYDVSWHNDVAACVADSDRDVLRVRVWDHGPGEHDADDESGGVRFAVSLYDADGDWTDEVYAGDDAAAAVAAFRAAVADVLAAARRAKDTEDSE